jgi:hypothetical protein
MSTYYYYSHLRTLNPSNGLKADIKTCDECCRALQSSINITDRGDIVLIMVDLKARVGLEQANSAYSTVGKYAADRQNQNDR